MLLKNMFRAIRRHLPDRRLHAVLTIGVPVVLTLLAGWGAFHLSLENNLDDLHTDENQLLSFQGWRLNDEINQYGLLPLAVARDPKIRDFFLHPERHHEHAIDRILETLNKSVGAMQTFLIAPDGRIAAASNWNMPGSFVGRNVSYRPYFQNANPNHAYRFSAIGTTDTVPGYYLSAEVVKDGHRIGVVALKIGLEQLRRHSLDAGRPLIVTDENDVVVMSSVKAWEYHRLRKVGTQFVGGRITPEIRKLRYGDNPLKPLLWTVRGKTRDGALLADMDGQRRAAPYLVLTRNMPEIGLRLTMLADTSAAYQLASAHSIVAMTLMALLSLIIVIIFLRRRVIRERISHQHDLEAAYNDLEILVEKRSHELNVANRDLRREISERTQAVEQLKNYQQELVRTENLTVIGQLSAGLAHEMNQPLGALSMLSDNTIRFLKRDQFEMVRTNVIRMGELVGRIGDIVHQLRSFARQNSGDDEVVDVAASIEAAQLMLSHRIRRKRVQVVVQAGNAPARVRCNKTRLEQVLVNLISNAMDATAGEDEPEIIIRWSIQDQHVRISVSDNGPGFDESVQSRLFEPFFTTKKTTGLGLGLAISADIIRSFGGALSGRATPGAGAVFTIMLPEAEESDV